MKQMYGFHALNCLLAFKFSNFKDQNKLVMAYNFCHHCLLPKIRCNAVTVDGFEASNLISANGSQRSKGFLVESFIKPPITITLQFPVNINVQKVIIAPAVGSQRSSGLELYSHSNRKRGTWLFDDSVQMVDKEGSKDDIADGRSNVYACLGRNYDDQAQCFTFTNDRFVQRNTLDSENKMVGHDLYDSNVSHAPLTARNNSLVESMSSLVVRITRSGHGSTCAIKWLEVWGNPARNAPRSWMEKMMRLKNDFLNPRQDIPFITIKETKGPEEPQIDEDSLPEEFLDPLTHEMLIMPILLPCGKTISQSSLDRHVEEQSKWGQPPTDPFTGQTFSNLSKPVPNSSLKARLDQFLFQNPALARVHDCRVGRKTLEHDLSAKSTISSVLLSSFEVDKPKPTKRKSDCFLAEQPFAKRKSIETTTTRYKQSAIFDMQPYPKSNTFHQLRTPSLSSSSTISLSKCSSSDLDLSLKNTLAGLPSFLGKSEIPESRVNEMECTLCQTHVDIAQLYKLPCSHLVCRSCLLPPRTNSSSQDSTQRSKVYCRRCGQYRDRSQAVKVHQ